MAFNLIREAQAHARLGEKATTAQAVSKILGKSSVTDVSGIFEAFDPAQHQITPDDYNNWMEVIQAEAAERGANLSKKSNFEDLAHLMFENDPRIDELGLDDRTKQSIVTAMWKSYQASKAHAGVEQGVNSAISRAREEEEASGFAQAFKAAKGIEDEEMKGCKKNPYPAGSLRHSLWNDVNGTEEEELHGDADMDLSSSAEQQPEGDDLDARVADLEARVGDIEAGEADEPWHDEEGGSDVDSGEDVTVSADGDEPVGDKSPIQRAARLEIEDEEKSKKSLFRQAITAPRQEMSQALKDVEAEGSSAWANLNLPPNPHPKKSQAFAAWQKGMKKAAKEALGIVDKPAMPAKKPAKRK